MTSTDGNNHSWQRNGLLELDKPGFENLAEQMGLPSYRGRQLAEWVFQKGVTSFDEMTNLPKAMRETLEASHRVFQSEIVAEQASTDGTVKLLLRWPDGATSECVMIPDGSRRTACISSQVGCPAGCVFCASGIGGLVRQLSSGEIVEQAMRVRQVCVGEARLSNVVFMGLGEPLANYANTVKAVRTINAPWGLGIAARKITVSTVGLANQMRRLADEKMQITLALSLHAPNDDLRQQIIPWAERVDLPDLIDACNYYFDCTGREVTLEYILLSGLNDSEDTAHQLADVAHQMRANINLLCYNPVEGLPYQRPPEEDALLFQSTLRQRGVNAHLRRSRGLDVDAACGQLRRKSGTDRN
ncbi:MAG: dual-specificity RNA methyltransferase RlmN [Planctomycetota bacterium]|jgi:23S rRNA (adenine2503-C2)-methyltransferase